MLRKTFIESSIDLKGVGLVGLEVLHVLSSGLVILDSGTTIDLGLLFRGLNSFSLFVLARLFLDSRAGVDLARLFLDSRGVVEGIYSSALESRIDINPDCLLENVVLFD
jgi:hypothetical protein